MRSYLSGFLFWALIGPLFQSVELFLIGFMLQIVQLSTGSVPNYLGLALP